MLQKFHASADTFTWPNGAIGHRPGGSFDCLGPYAKVVNCPISGTTLRRTCYATGYADTFFSVPACTRINGKYVAGYFSVGENGIYDGIVFNPMDRHKHRVPSWFAGQIPWNQYECDYCRDLVMVAATGGVPEESILSYLDTQIAGARRDNVLEAIDYLQMLRRYWLKSARYLALPQQ